VRVAKHWDKAQRGCEIPIFGDIKNETGQDPEQLALICSELRIELETSEAPSDLNHFMI